MQHWILRPPSPLKYSDVFYGWTLMDIARINWLHLLYFMRIIYSVIYVYLQIYGKMPNFERCDVLQVPTSYVKNTKKSQRKNTNKQCFFPSNKMPTKPSPLSLKQYSLHSVATHIELLSYGQLKVSNYYWVKKYVREPSSFIKK